jgi:hypothetical protein
MNKHNAVIYILFAIVCMTNSCKENPADIINNNYYISNDSLNNPTVLPRVLFTNPANGAIGPFTIVDPTQYQDLPRITIQLSKLINVLDLKTNTVSLKSGDQSYSIYLFDYYSGGSGYKDPSLRNILVYSVGSKYLSGKTYTLTIDTSLVDIHGNRLTQPYVVSFTPEPKFRVYHAYPSLIDIDPNSFALNLTGPINMSFNSVVDSSIYGKIAITPSIKGMWSLNNPSYTSGDSTTLTFVTSDTLLCETEYVVGISSLAKDVYGSTINAAYQFSFKTAPFNVSLSSYYTSFPGFSVQNGFRFKFNSLVDTSTVRQSISITPAITHSITLYAPSSGRYDEVDLYLNEQEFKPNTKYTILLSATIRSTKGNYLKQQYSYSFTTGSKKI